ncbi:MAG: PaaI family thioesterase [Bradymonadaceae bacterium]
MNDQFIQALVNREDTVEYWRQMMDDYADQTAMGPHDVELVDVDDDEIVLEMPMGDHARQVAGILHGGISMLLAETAASMHACWGVDLTERQPVGIEISGSHLRSAVDGTIRAVGEVLRRGETHIVHEVAIRHAERDETLSECRVTNFYKQPDE